MKVRFAVSAYRSKNVAMHCRTEDEADTFLKYLHSIGRHWLSGRRYDEYTEWHDYGESTIYLFNKGLYGNIHGRENANLRVLEFSDFDWDIKQKKTISVISFVEVVCF